MKKTIILLILLCTTKVWSEVTIHENVFSLDQVQSEAASFYGRMYRWTAWSNTETSKSFDVSPDPIKQSYEAGMPVHELPELDEDVLLSVLPGDDGENLADYYYDRDPAPSKRDYCLLGEDCNRPYPQVVFNTKVAVSVSDEAKLDEISLSEFIQLFSEADQPHTHTKVTRDFARRFIYNAHLAHDQIENHTNDEIYLSVLDFSWERYQCRDLSQALWARTGSEVIYTINLLSELTDEQIAKNNVIEPDAIRVFEQKTIFSSELLRSAQNYLALYPDGDSFKLVLYGTMVGHHEIEKMISPFLNGVTWFAIFKNAASQTIPFNRDGVALLNSDNLDLASVSGNCTKGLGPGVGRYIYGLANKIANE